MPRPKRSKIAPSITMAKTNAKATAKTTAESSPQDNAATVALQRTHTANNAVRDDTGGNNPPVATIRSTRALRRATARGSLSTGDAADTLMTGTLPVAKPSQQIVEVHTPATSSMNKSRMTRGNNQSYELQSSRPAVIPTATQSLAQDTANLLKNNEPTLYEDLSFSSLNSDSIDHGTRPPSAIKVGATPAHETSLMALTNFKRRARQPSLLRMVQQTINVEDDLSDDLRDQEAFDSELSLPDAESTPFNFSRETSRDKSRDFDVHNSSSSSRGVKRKLSPVVQVPRSSPPFGPSSGGDVDSERSPSPSLPDILPSREDVVEQTQDNEEPLSETYAPPKSSSPIIEIAALDHLPRTRTRRGQPVRNVIADSGSDTDVTKTPLNIKRRTVHKAQPTISTAQLKDLLPRRRKYRPADYDDSDAASSEITQMESDRDELQMPPPRRNRQRATSGKMASPKGAKKSTKGRKPVAGKARQSRTYSRRLASDKENDRGSDTIEEPSEASIVQQSERLAAIKKKFEEVDAFELDFETVADVTTSSSPFR